MRFRRKHLVVMGEENSDQNKTIIERGFHIYRTEGCLKACRVTFEFLYKILRDGYRKVANWIYARTDSRRLTSPEHIYGENYYQKRKHGKRRDEAEHVAEVLDERFNPDSVIDFGCAIGHYLHYFFNKGLVVKGVEGNVNAFEHAVVPQEYLHHADLRDPYETQQKYDLAICFEVAEHLAESHADTLVKSLTSSATTIAFTAATPGQSGTHHVNEQPRSYWINKFKEYGYIYDEQKTIDIRSRLNLSETTEIEENLFIFRPT